MTAAELKERLRARYPATEFLNGRYIVGGWTVIEEWLGIDVLAFSAHQSPKPNMKCRYPRVGHEVKVSRSDYRRELLAPSKRVIQVGWCNVFYFVTPKGLLKPHELRYQEPEWGDGDFTREHCPNGCYGGEREVPLIGPLQEFYRYRPTVRVPCDGCGGKGYLTKSRVEREAPTLWVPRDVGLIEVDARGCRVVRPAPVKRVVPGVVTPSMLNSMIRWVSARPDSRHERLRGVPGVSSTDG